MTSLRERVGVEFENIERALAELPEARPISDLSTLELAGVSTLLHNYYSGIENKHVVQHRELDVPAGGSWHLQPLTEKVWIVFDSFREDIEQLLSREDSAED